MAHQVCAGALLRCSFGMAPSALSVTPEKRVATGGAADANVMDHAPMKNVQPFGLCVTSSNPQVSSARGAPQPCMPVTAQPWSPGSSSVKVGGQAALQSACQLRCQWGGVITVLQAGQATVNTA